MVGLVTRLQEGLAKGRIERRLARYCFPDFVANHHVADLRETLPVFCFHAVKAPEFESALRHLKRNGYQTLTADRLVGCLNGDQSAEKAVVLTFDDGWRSVWTVAYPLLKKYGFCGVSFLVPTWMSEEQPSVTLEDHWSGRISLDKVHHLEREQPYLSWSEAAIMQDEGVFEFQSHSYTHDTVFTSGKLVDFVNPAFHRVPHKIPLVGGIDMNPWNRSKALGMPLYTVAPRLSGAIRYIDNDELRERCLTLVQEQGGEGFFAAADWRKKLREICDEAIVATSNAGLETESQRDEGIRRELRESKRAIEVRLGNTVRHFCFPFYAGSELASTISEELGYVSNFWGWKPISNKRTSEYGRNHLYAALDETDYSTGDVLQGRRVNTVGDSPFRIVRVPGDYIHRLPGSGRRSLISMFVRKCVRNLKT